MSASANFILWRSVHVWKHFLLPEEISPEMHAMAGVSILEGAIDHIYESRQRSKDCVNSSTNEYEME